MNEKDTHELLEAVKVVHGWWLDDGFDTNYAFMQNAVADLCNVYESLTETMQLSSESDVVQPAGSCQQVVDYWNAQASKVSGLVTVRKLTQTRRRKLQARLNDCDWPWQDAIDSLPIPNSKTFRWQPDFDWLIRNDSNAYKLAEGGFGVQVAKGWEF